MALICCGRNGRIPVLKQSKGSGFGPRKGPVVGYKWRPNANYKGVVLDFNFQPNISFYVT